MNKRVKSFLVSTIAMTLSLAAMSVNTVMAVQEDTVTESSETAEEITFTADIINYTVIDETNVSVSGLSEYATELEVPETVVYNDIEYTVTEIGERAFERKGIRHITLPSTMTAIGELAFYYSSLEEIVIPNNVVTIGNGALSYCSNLTNLTLPDGVKSIGERAFSMSTKLESISVPASVESIGKDAFYFCSALKTITYGLSEERWTALSAEANVPEGVTVIYNYSEAKVYNTSELTMGQKLKAGDTLHYDDVNSIGSVANVVNTSGSFDNIHFIGNEDYVLPWNAEFVGTYGMIIYLAPEYEDISYTDVRTLNVGDVIDNESYLLCYDYIVNGVWSPVFLPSYYEEYVGEGTIRLKSIDTEAKTAELEAVQETVVSGDANGDGEFNVADAVTLQKYLLCAEDCESVNAERADMNSDGVVDVFDMIFLRKQLITK